MKKRLMSVVLALAMVIGVMPTAAFATEEKETINYVSLGDSMTNGYGGVGYKQQGETSNDYKLSKAEAEAKNVYGEGAYPLRFEEHLEKKGYDVNHTKLALSAMLPEHLLYLLSSDKTVNNYNDMPTPVYWGFRSYDGGLGASEMKTLFQESVADADIISMSIGNGTFGAFLMDMMTRAVGMGGGDYIEEAEELTLENALALLENEEQRELVLQVYDDLKAEMSAYVDLGIVGNAPGTDKPALEAICDVMAYGAAILILSYEGILEQIDVLNGDKEQEVILVGLMNTLAGVNFVDDDGEVLLPMGDVMNVAFSALNAYMAALPVAMQVEEKLEGMTFYYAEDMEVECFCDIFGDVYDFDTETWDEDYSDGRVDVGTLYDRTVGAVADMVLNPMAGITKGQLLDGLGLYETSQGDAPFFAPQSEGGLGALFAVVGAYKGIEKAVAANMGRDVPLSSLLAMADLEGTLSTVFNPQDLGNLYDRVFDETGDGKAAVQAVQDHVYGILNDGGMFAGMCNVFGLFKLGDGMSVHPTPEGHDALAAAVIDTYANEHTASDETVDNIMEAVQILIANYETVYHYAYQYAEGQGYIAQADELLNEIESEIAAIDVASLGLSDELTAEVEKLKTQILGDVQALRTLVSESPEHADAVSNFYALCDELIADLAALEAVAGQAGEELYEAALALQAKLEEALTEALKTADEEIRAAYEKVVEEITALAEQYGPEAEAFIREWLYENPKAVLETILAYGEDIDTMLNHWNYHLQLILGPAWNAYGEDLLAALEEVLALLGEEAAALSAQAAAELLTYIESLNLDTQIEAIANAVMNGSVTIGEETLTELEEIAADLEKDLETNVKAVIDALETVAYGADSQAAKAEIEKVIELVKATEAELKGEIALIEQDIAALAALLEKSYNGATDEIPDIARQIRKLLDDPMAVLELDGEDLAHVRAVLETLCETLKEIQTSAEAISKLTTDITNAAKTINTAILTMNGELKTAVDGIETTLTEAGADAETLLAETYEAIEAFVTTTADTVYTDASALMAVCELKLTAAVNELVAAIENVVSKAVSGSVKGDCTSVYTAIGDEVEGLAEALGLTAGELSEKTALVTVNFEGEELSAFVNAQIAGMIADTVEMNEDLVNILNGGYGATILAEIEKLGIDLKAETATLDWGKYLDEKAIGVKNETLAGIAQVLMDHEALVETYTIDVGEIISPIISEQIGLEITVNCVAQIPVAELAIAAVDNLLYAYVESAAAFAAELEAVRAVAPEAEVVVLGLTDAAEELQVKIGNMTLDLAEYEEVLNAFVSAHYFAYALVNGENTTFVADAEAIAEALSVDVAGHVWNAYEKKDDETHYLVCSVCGAKGETEAHTLVDNKCVCGYEKVVEEEDRPSGGSSRPKHCPWCKTNTCHSAAFTDLDLDAWYHEYTDYVLCKGLMNGMGGTIFAPNATATRAMIITTLYRMEGSPAVTGEITFSDVAADTWYSDAVVWATQNGIVNGFADGTFAPMQNVTREQIAAIFFRLAELKGVKTDKAAELSPAYDDAGDVGAWAVKYMQWAVGEGLMKGRSTHMLVPAGETTRAETAALLQRWCEEIAD